MNEHILAPRFGLDETVAFGGVEPFHNALGHYQYLPREHVTAIFWNTAREHLFLQAEKAQGIIADVTVVGSKIFRRDIAPPERPSPNQTPSCPSHVAVGQARTC